MEKRTELAEARIRIGRAVRGLREARAVSAETAAKHIGLPPRFYRAIEAGRRDLLWIEALVLADLFDATPGDLARLALGSPAGGPREPASGAPSIAHGSQHEAVVPINGGARATVTDLAQAARMRQAREACGLSREQVVGTLGWRLSRLTSLENGSRAPSLNEALGLTRLYALEGLRMVDELEGSRQPRGAPQ